MRPKDDYLNQTRQPSSIPMIYHASFTRREESNTSTYRPSGTIGVPTSGFHVDSHALFQKSQQCKFVGCHGSAPHGVVFPSSWLKTISLAGFKCLCFSWSCKACFRSFWYSPSSAEVRRFLISSCMVSFTRWSEEWCEPLCSTISVSPQLCLLWQPALLSPKVGSLTATYLLLSPLEIHWMLEFLVSHRFAR